MPEILAPYARLVPIAMLMVSNLFMTFAWYGHLKYKSEALWIVVLTSWGLAFFEYWFAVPANRWGSSVYSAAELKTIQEVVTLLVFAVFSVLYLKQPFTWNYAVGFVFIGVGAWFIFRGPING
ncbi:DMT family protein [Ferrovibrio xuzhouensis]|uniref:DMT family protein n=1 Tax=Ferrovibrio xuzhouensis TaxID=1576914 RepID=A0ABV7VN33_9PROT